MRKVSAADACKVASVSRKVDVDDLIDTQDVARILGLAHRNTVSEYQARYDDMPRPVVNLGRGRSKLWLRREIQGWADRRAANIRARRSSSP